MTRLIAAALALTALLTAGCGVNPSAPAQVRQSAKVGTRYLVFFVDETQVKPAPAGAAFKFSSATIIGHGTFPDTQKLTLGATFKSVKGKVEVALTREGKPMTADERSFYLSQFSNGLVMGRPDAQATEVMKEVLKWAGSPFDAR